MKQCSKCGEWKDESEYYKARNACKACERERTRAYRMAHLDQRRAYEWEYNQAHRADRAEYSRMYSATHTGPGEYPSHDPAYRRSHRSENTRETERRYWAEHRDAQRAKGRRNYANNSEKRKIAASDYYYTHHEPARATGREYYRKHREEDITRRHNRYVTHGEYFERLGITPTQELVDLKAKQIALVRAIRKQKEAKA